MVAAG